MERLARLDLVRHDRGAEVRAEVDRVLASRLFKSSPRLSRFLEYIAEKTLEGHQQEIKEYAIGVEVCEQGANFDPRIDPIVRIDARRLRTRLREYYSGEGASDPLRIGLEPGTYVPSFDGGQPAPASHSKDPAARSIAVLPMQNLGGAAHDALVCDGLTEGLITALARTPGLNVVSRTSTFVFKNSSRDLREIGEVLNVNGILEGSVQHMADRWRITVRLVHAGNGCVLWSQVFDCGEALPFQLQDEIGAEVCRQLGVVRWTAAHATRRIADEAWALFCKGRHQLLKWNPGGVTLAIQLFEAAIEEDPNFAQAYAGLAEARVWLGLYGVCKPREALLPARFAAEKAVAIDASTAEAWGALGSLRAVLDWDWAGADRDFHRALELNPSLTEAMTAYAGLLAFQGRLRESQEIIDRAMIADPLSLVVRSQRALVAAFSGDEGAAIRLYQEVLEIEPRFPRPHWALGILFSRMGRFDLALSHYESARMAIGDAPFLLGWHGHCLGLAGRNEEALAIQAQLVDLAATRFVPAFAHALILLGQGDHAGALDRFEAACEERTVWALELKSSASFRCLHGQLRYHALLRRMRLE